jgi:hypothetical protein
MSRPWLGVTFGDALYPERLSGEDAPSLDRPPRPGTIERLVRCLAAYDVFIYPEDPGPERASAMFGWLLTNLRRYFERAGVPDASTQAEAASELITVCGARPAGIAREVCAPEGWPGDEDIRGLEHPTSRRSRQRHADGYA